MDRHGDPSDPTSGTGGDARAARAVRSIVCMGRVFERVGRGAGLSLPQYRLLLFLRHGPKRAGELAAEAAIQRPTLTALVAALEREDRLRRVADETDGRGVRIEITPAGTDALLRTEARLVEVVEGLLAAGDRDHLLDAFDDFAGLIDLEVDRRLHDDRRPAPERR